VAALADLAEVALPLIRVGGRLVAWKRAGAALDDELPAAARALDALGGGEPVVQPVQVEGLEDHRLVVITKRRPTPDRWPRSPAERKRRPW
jgi:16S rRNA (guanine527-N7)-methyltransferase